MRHYRRADNADADIEHALIRDNFRTRNKTEHDAGDPWPGKKQLAAKQPPMVTIKVITNASM
ncbi:MAG: hypothetical protein WDN00_14980 [Limisphaerales bacterium]